MLTVQRSPALVSVGKSILYVLIMLLCNWEMKNGHREEGCLHYCTKEMNCDSIADVRNLEMDGIDKGSEEGNEYIPCEEGK